MNQVLILVNHDVVIYNFRMELVQCLVSEGYEVHISSPVGDHTEDLKNTGAHFHEITFDRHGMNPLDEIKLLGYYKRLMKSIKPLIVFTYTVKCNIYGGMAARFLHIPFCANITGLGITVNGGGIRERIVVALYKFGLRSAQRVFFQNEENMRFMVDRGIVSSPYTVLPGSGVNLSTHSYEPYPSDDNGIIISYIGRIMKDKGTDELLAAAGEITQRHPEVKIRLIGFFDDDYEDKIRNAENHGTVQYIQQQRDIHPWMAETHALIMPSYHEGMSNVVLEAASTGRPVLASDIPGCRESIDDRKTGLLFESQSSTAVINAIEQFLTMSNEERSNMGKLGRKKMEQEFGRTIVVDKYMDEVRKAEIILLHKVGGR